MTTEYSINVSDWQDQKWNYIGSDLMYEYYLKDKETIQECKDNGYDLEDIAREKSDEHYPMMNYAYPLGFKPDEDKIIEVCTRTNLTVVEDEETGEWFLALTGGGMDLSQDIALAYLIIQDWIPTALAYNVCTQPCLSVSGKDWLLIMEDIKKRLGFGRDNYEQRIQEINRKIKEYEERQKK